MVEVTAAATAVAILDLVALSLINPLVQKVGKIEVMEILLKTLNMKMVGVGEKEDLHLLKWQMKRLSQKLLMVCKERNLWAGH